MKSLMEDWKNMFSHQKQVGHTVIPYSFFLFLCTVASVLRYPICSTSQVYTQLAEDDKIRYKNEMKSWEEHMVEIGREDLIRGQTLSTKKKPAAKTPLARKGTKKAKAVKATATTKSGTTRKTMTTSISTKSVKSTKKT